MSLSSKLKGFNEIKKGRLPGFIHIKELLKEKNIVIGALKEVFKI